MEPELSTPCRKGRKRGGKSQKENRTSVRQDLALLMTAGLTPIMLVGRVHDTAHAHSTGNIHQESRNQAGAPRAGVGLQPPTSAAHSDGADGADQAMHRGHCRRMPPPLARGGASGRPLRSRGRRAVAGASRANSSPPVARTARPRCRRKGRFKVPPRPPLRPILHRRGKLQRAALLPRVAATQQDFRFGNQTGSTRTRVGCRRWRSAIAGSTNSRPSANGQRSTANEL